MTLNKNLKEGHIEKGDALVSIHLNYKRPRLSIMEEILQNLPSEKQAMMR